MGPLLVRLDVATELVYTALTVALYLGFDGALAHSDATLKASVCTTLVTGTDGWTTMTRGSRVMPATGAISRRKLKPRLG